MTSRLAKNYGPFPSSEEAVTHDDIHAKRRNGSIGNTRFGTVAIVLISTVITAVIVHTIDRTMMLNPKLSSSSVQRNPTSIRTNNPIQDPDASAPWPRIAWLMSFPNSGTTYTVDMVTTTTDTSTATNYGMETSESTSNTPVFTNDINGPFWKFPDRRKPSEKSYIMTKTHCGGRCTKCRPEAYVETTRSFGIACRSGGRRAVNGTAIVKELVTYRQGVAQRAIHLIRNPFDNLVSRLHYERSYWKRKKGISRYEDRLEIFTPDKKGLKAWCKMIDEERKDQELESRFIDDELYALERDLPCHAEFFRYIQWHVQAIEVTHRLKLPVLYLFYENYTTNFDETVNEVLSFLNHDKIAPAPTFLTGKHYEDYFELRECRMVAKLIRELASDEAWSMIKHYLEQWL